MFQGPDAAANVIGSPIDCAERVLILAITLPFPTKLIVASPFST